MFENWLADQMDDAELAKNHAYLLGSFWNPEQVKKLLGDSANTHVSDDKAFEESTNMLKTNNIPGVSKLDEIPKRKRQKKIKV